MVRREPRIHIGQQLQVLTIPLVMELVEEHCAKGGMCVMAAHQDVEIAAPTTRVKIQ